MEREIEKYKGYTIIPDAFGTYYIKEHNPEAKTTNLKSIKEWIDKHPIRGNQ